VGSGCSRRGIEKVGYLAFALSSVPVAWGIAHGQAILLVAAGVAGCWWLLKRQHSMAAGIALALVLVKPHLAVLVPVALAAAGYWRTVVAFLGTVAAVAVVVLVTVGAARMASLFAQLDYVSRHSVEFLNASYLSLPGLIQERIPASLGAAPTALAVTGIVVVAGRAAFLARGTGPETALVAGVLGSAIVTPYLHLYDVSVLALVAWLFLRTNPAPWQVAILTLLYLSANGEAFSNQAPVAVLEVALLASLLHRREKVSQET